MALLPGAQEALPGGLQRLIYCLGATLEIQRAGNAAPSFQRREVLKTIKMLNEQFGITVIFITHYMDEAVKADRVIVMDDGKIILDGKPREVFTEIDTLKAVGLDVPEATELSSMLSGSGIELEKDILDTDELFEAIVKILEAKN